MKRTIWRQPKNLGSDERTAIDLANRLIAEKINAIWRARRLPNNIPDVMSEQTFINIQRVKYIYPDYADLVGPPTETDFINVTRRNGTIQRQLTPERKADLLLLGVYMWKGMYIAQPTLNFDAPPTGWLLFTEPGYQPDDWLGTYYRNYLHGLLDDLTQTPFHHNEDDDVEFLPYRGHETSLLHDYLVECDIELGNRPPRTKFQRVRFGDDNPYNCLPDNLSLIEKRGRRMRCVGCEQPTTAKDSKVLRDRDHRLRYCYACLARKL